MAHSTEAAARPKNVGSERGICSKSALEKDKGSATLVSQVMPTPMSPDSGTIHASGSRVWRGPCLTRELHSMPGTITPMSANSMPCTWVPKRYSLPTTHSAPQTTPTKSPMAKICRGRGSQILSTTYLMSSHATTETRTVNTTFHGMYREAARYPTVSEPPTETCRERK